MKELKRFRQFLAEGLVNENQMKNLAKLLRDEADQPDNKVGKNIFLKYAAQVEKTDVKDIKSLLQKLEDELIDKHPDTFSGEDDIVGSFLSTSKNYTAEGQIHEGTWGYGSKNQMLKALDKLNKIGQMGGVKGSVELSKIDDMLYNVFGNDDFHDSIDQAKDNAIDDDRFANYIGDAQAKGMKMLNDIYSDKGANAFTKAADNPDVVGRDMMEDLSENDKALDEIIGEEKESLTKQIMKKYPKKYPDEKAVKVAAAKLMKDPKFKVKKGIGPVLQALLKGK